MALALLLWRVWRPAEAGGGHLTVSEAGQLRAALTAATRSPVEGMTVRLDHVPSPEERAWLRAIAASGTGVGWEGAPDLRPAALAVEPLADPAGARRVTALVAPGAALALRDAGGLADSVESARGGVRVVEGPWSGDLTLQTPGSTPLAPIRDSLLLRPVLVVGRAGWEGKFVVASLEEAGWVVHARFHVAPGVAVTQVSSGLPPPSATSDARPPRSGSRSIPVGALPPMDTSRYAAVVVLDASAASVAPAVARFVRDGGGVIVLPGASSLPALAAVLPARRGDSLRTALGALSSAAPRNGLAASGLVGFKPGAVVLERRGGSVVMAAARAGAGRALFVGYHDSWLWRMAGAEGGSGGAGGVAAHRAWWSGLVSAVAYAPRAPSSPGAPGAGGVAAPVAEGATRAGDGATSGRVDQAPYAALVAALGRAAPSPSAATTTPPLPWNALLFALTLAALLAEWASRRTRGAR